MLDVSEDKELLDRNVQTDVEMFWGSWVNMTDERNASSAHPASTSADLQSGPDNNYESSSDSLTEAPVQTGINSLSKYHLKKTKVI